MKRKIEILLLSLILTVVVTVGISSATKGLVIQPGDVNGDGSINAKDAVMLAQYLAGWDVVLGGDSHTVVIDAAVPATCTQTGLTEGKHCSDCGMILVKQQVVPMADHDYEDTVVPPTETEKGYTFHKCKNCGREMTDSYTGATLAKGLEYTIANGACTITGIGTCTETEVYIPDMIENCPVTAIADKAFADQTHITKIGLPSTVKILGQRAFYGCTGLTEFTVPASVTSVGHQVLYKCDNLATVYYNSSFSPDKDKVFLNIPSIKTVVFGGTSVPYRICYNCTNIEKVEILDSVKYIGLQYSYSDSYSFYGCTSLKEVTIGDSVTSIGYYAFYNCSSLTSVEIGNSVTSIGDYAFCGCSSLTAIDVSDMNTTYCDIDGVLFSKDKKTLVAYPCGGATTYTIPDSVTSIGGSAFRGCSSLTSVEIPDSVTSIGSYAFSGCRSLTSVEIPASVTSIGKGAFEYCSSLTSVYYGGDATKWAAISIGSYNSSLASATRYYYSATQPTTSGNYWHYVDGKSTPW